MRTKHSVKNIVSSMGFTLVKSLMAFLARTVFISTLGISYLGVSGLLTNVLSMLSLAELGIATAINFSLYKPIAEDDREKISRLMTFYKKTYRYIGIIVFAIGLAIMPFLDVIIKDLEGVQDLRIIFFLYLVNTATSYFVSYKETLINADQRGYKIVPYNTFFWIAMTVLQIAALILTKSFIIYLAVQIVMSFIQRFSINRFITKTYKEVNFSNDKKLPESDLMTIKKNVKAMVFHKIGDYVINGTDNIIISAFISISKVGIYSNYILILGTVNQFINVVFTSVTASLGNMIVKEDENKGEEVFNVINFIGFWIFSFSTVCFYNLLNPFVTLWIGERFLMEKLTVAVFVANFYITGMRVPVATIKAAAGIYDEDKFTPIIQSAINLFFSIFLVRIYGLTGVLLGTLISSIALPSWYRPMIVYRHVFKKTSRAYFKKYLVYGLVTVLSTVVTYYAIAAICPGGTIREFIFKTLLSVAIPNAIIAATFFKSREFKYIKRIMEGFRLG